MPWGYLRVTRPSSGTAQRWPDWLVWVLAFALAVGLALTRMPGVFIDGAVHPIGNDSFYHAVRMLAIAADPTSTHAFDSRLNWPDGLWIAWPWAYDYLGGVVAGAIASGRNATMHLLAFYPLIWLLGSVSVMALIARQLFAWPLRAVCVLAYAVAPLTLSLYEVGNLDHHGAEHFWLLLGLYLSGRWLTQPQSMRLAAGLGVVLGAATAFHDSLFLLQVPLVLSLLLARLLDHEVPKARAGLTFGISLLVVQILVLLPSHAFQTGVYRFYEQSWFHLHVAALTALSVWGVSLTQRRRMWLVLLLAVLAALPATHQLLFGLEYVRSQLPQFGILRETRAPLGGSMSFLQLSNFYSGLFWLWPVCLFYAVYRLVKHSVAGMSLAVVVSALVWLPLMLTQIRMYYFGYASLILLSLMLIQKAARKPLHGWIGAGMMLAAMSFSLHLYLTPIAPGGSPRYTSGWPLIYAARAQCDKAPGLLLADHNWGNFLRYQTDCSLIANNFGVAPTEVAAMSKSIAMLAMSPAELRRHYPAVQYVLVSRMELNESPLAGQLLSTAHTAGYRVVKLMKDREGRVMGGLYQVQTARPD
jgi:hypothetical protein